MKHYDHTHTTVAEARECEANRGVAKSQADRYDDQVARGVRPTAVEVNDRLRRVHTNSAIMASLTGQEYRPYAPLTPQAARRMDAKFNRMNRTSTPTRSTAPEPQPSVTERPAHPKRVAYANDLLMNRNTSGIPKELAEAMAKLLDEKPLTATEVDQVIRTLQAQPRLSPEGQAARMEVVAKYREMFNGKPTTPAIPQAPEAVATKLSEPSLRDVAEGLADKGYYALRTPGTADEIHYYRVTRSPKGYIKVQEQASDTLWPVDYRRALAVVKAIIESGEEAARHLYANTLERCYRCGRTLTDETSRRLGIGPDCRSK